jgi:hypothetical protein
LNPVHSAAATPSHPFFSQTAARTLSELCRKLGESIIADILPILHKGMSADESTRRGVCLALKEIVESTSKGQMEEQEDNIITAIKTALVDPSASVRAAAAQAFSSMQRVLGPQAITSTLPSLLEALHQPGSNADAALAALTEMLVIFVFGYTGTVANISRYTACRSKPTSFSQFFSRA